jgi:hypothetical protein
LAVSWASHQISLCPNLSLSFLTTVTTVLVLLECQQHNYNCRLQILPQS